MRILLSFVAVGLFHCAAADGFDAGTVDFAKPNGRLRRELHCSGVTPRMGQLQINDYRAEFRKIRFTSTRTHDLSLCDPNQRVIDTHHIFPLLHLDEKNPDNYYFTATDALIKQIVGLDSQVFYRLGTSIDHLPAGEHINTVPPPDNAKYARILEGIIRHYNYGWGKGGMNRGIAYWEVWNEPDLHKGKNGENLNGTCWDGTMDEFYEFYATVAKHLKAQFPELKIGGPAFAGLEFAEPFIARMAKNKVPIDFFSWHGYNRTFEEFSQEIKRMRGLLDEAGYKNTELIINEWHYLGKKGWGNTGWRACGSGTPDDIKLLAHHHSIDGVWGVNSAAYNVAMVATFHDTALDWSFYYYGEGYNKTWGLWDLARQPHRNYYSMLMLGDLINDFPNRVEAVGNKPVYLLAGKSDAGRAALLVSDFCGSSPEIRLTLKGLSFPKKFEMRRIDAEHKYKVGSLTLTDENLVLTKPAADQSASAVWLLIEESNNMP